MSMNGCFRSLSADVIAAVRKDPSLVTALTAPSFAQAPSPALLAIPGMKEHFAAITAARQQLEARIPNLADGVGRLVEIEKAWHGLHFVLTGSAEPADDDAPRGQAVFGGEDVGEDLGYGAARLLDPDDVRAVHEALVAFDDAALAGAFDPDRMNEEAVYPEVWDDEGETLDWIADALDRVRDAYGDAARRGHGMLLWLS